MFSDRFRGARAFAALLAFASLCHLARRQVPAADPPLESLPLRFDAIQGRRVCVNAKTVLASGPEWVDVHTSSGPVRVLGQSSPAARKGDVLSAVGTAAGPRLVLGERLRTHPGFVWKRRLNYAVSVLTFGVFLLWARRFLLGRRGDGLLRSRD